MLDGTTDPHKIIIACRFIQHDQWLTTHVEPQWTIRQLKLWLVHRLFGISIPSRTFTTPPQNGQQPERPPSPITFAPDPRNRPASPIVFAAPQKGGLYSSVGGGVAAASSAGGGGNGGGGRAVKARGILSDTDEDLLSGSESGFSSSGRAGKEKGKGHMDEIRIETGPPVLSGSSSVIPGGRIGPSYVGVSDTDSITSGIAITGHTVASPATYTGYTAPDADRFPGGVNPHHWTLTRYSTGQILCDDEQIFWYDIAEFELLELHGLSFPSYHLLYEYQVCHLWNPDRHRERERLRKKLKKRFEAEAARDAKERDKDKDGTGGSTTAAAKRAILHAQILKAMNLNSGAGANVGVVEYYGSKLASTQVELTLTRIPRPIDLYIQPYWEGWVRTLRIVWRGDWDDIAFANAAGSHSITLPPHHAGPGILNTAAVSSGGPGVDPYKYGAYAAAGTMMAGLGGMYHGPAGTPSVPPGATGDKDPEFGVRSQKIVRVEWRERWVRIQNGILAVLKDREDEDATHVLPLRSLISIHNTQHLTRYLSYTGFNPPRDHPSVNREILIPALDLPIPRPPMPTGYSSHYANSHSHSSKSKSSSSTAYSHAYPDSDDSDTLLRHHRRHSRHGHGNSGSGHGHGSFGGGHQPSNFNFPSSRYLQAHVKARELTPLVGSRFDPTYLPVTIEEQKASGLRVVCLQFRKHSSIGSSSSSAAAAAGRPSLSSHSYYPKGHDGVTAERERGGGRGGSSGGDKEHKVLKDREIDIDPITLALEDMKERAGEWGGIRSDNLLWKCPHRLRREPPYLIRARVRMAKLRTFSSSGKQSSRSGAAVPPSVAGGSIISDARSSTIRGLSDSIYSASSAPYYEHLGHNLYSTGGRGSPSLKRTSGTIHKERHYEREQRRHRSTRDTTDIDMHAILAAQIFGGAIPGSGRHFKESIEEKERKEMKEMRKREKELEKERTKQEKKGKGKGKEKEKEKDVVGGDGGRKDEKVDKDWNLGSLNVGFFGWGKKKRAKKEEQLRSHQDHQQETGNLDFTHRSNDSSAAFPKPSFASNSLSQPHSNTHEQGSLTSASTTSVGTGISTNTITGSTNPTASSSTIIGRGSRGVGGGGTVEAGVHSSEDEDDDGGRQLEFAQYRRAESSGLHSTEDEDEEEEEDDDDDDEDDDEEELEENDENVVEPYPDAVPETRHTVEEEEGEELIEYANQPSTTSIQNPSQEGDGGGHNTATSQVNQYSNAGSGVPNLILQIAVDKRVETELSDGTGRHIPNTVNFSGRAFVPSPLNTSPPTRFSPSPTNTKQVSIDTNTRRTGSSAGGRGEGGRSSRSQSQAKAVSKKQNQRLIGQLHSSGEENGEEDPEQENEEEELSSPVFAPPPHMSRRRLIRIKSPVPFSTNLTRSTSSQGSHASIDEVEGGEGEEGYDFDDDLDFEDEFLGHRRAGYRYGSYDIKRDEDRKKKVEQLEEEKEKRIKELRELEEREREREKREREREREREKERERRERRRKEEEGEWVCLDIGNDFAFQSFLRIVHQHCPHPMKSTFMDRMAGAPLNDVPPPPQNLPQPLITNANAGPLKNSGRPSSASAQLHHSPTQSQLEIPPGTESVVGKDALNRHSFPNPPTSLLSHRQTSSRTSDMSPAPQTPASTPTSPAAPSIPGASSASYGVPPSPSPSEGYPSEGDDEMDSEAEYVAPLPGYGDPRFVYPSRTFATPPYPEWRVNVMRKAQHAGMGDVGRAMEFIHWGHDDPVISTASGAVNDLEKMGRLWGSRGGVPGFPGAVEKNTKQKRRQSGLSDNVSSLGTIGPRTVGSGGTVKGVPRSPKEQRRRLSLRSPGGIGPVKGAIAKADREGGESGNESSREASDGSAGGNTSASDTGKTPKSPRFNAISDMANRLSNWSDDEEEYASEMEWTAWHIDILRQSKRQYAIQARRAANSAVGAAGELDLGIPVDPADDMKRYLKNRYDMEPRAKITKPPEDTATLSVSVTNPNPLSASRSVGHSSTATSIMSTSPPSRITSDALSPHHARTPSQQHPTLHHSASLHTGLRKGAQESPLRRPSMPILNPEKDKGKGKERSFWNITGFSATSDEVKSPTAINSGWFSRKEMMSPIGTASQPPSAGGSVARSGNVLLKGGLLRKKDSGDVNREKDRERDKDRGKMTESEKELKKGQRPQLWVATSSSAMSSSANPVESSKSPEQVKSPTFAPGRLVRRMRSDASILSIRANDPTPEPSSPRQVKKKKGMVKLLDSSLDFVEGK